MCPALLERFHLKPRKDPTLWIWHIASRLLPLAGLVGRNDGQEPLRNRSENGQKGHSAYVILRRRVASDVAESSAVGVILLSPTSPAVSTTSVARSVTSSKGGRKCAPMEYFDCSLRASIVMVSAFGVVITLTAAAMDMDEPESEMFRPLPPPPPLPKLRRRRAWRATSASLPAPPRKTMRLEPDDVGKNASGVEEPIQEVEKQRAEEASTSSEIRQASVDEEEEHREEECSGLTYCSVVRQHVHASACRLKMELGVLEGGIDIESGTTVWKYFPVIKNGVIDFGDLNTIYMSPRWQSHQSYHLCVAPGEQIERSLSVRVLLVYAYPAPIVAPAPGYLRAPKDESVPGPIVAPAPGRLRAPKDDSAPGPIVAPAPG
ncbi:unnamed protein product [Heligmosomoides polygyrus]|uniref:Uncharacterized protein n=1 Tax=Heligmosomoides polygyrus TaxID=6339 RepID=A0A3P7U7S3_HELPZ|nr:unnamed protein product [Heligmosomoides polygyrus]